MEQLTIDTGLREYAVNGGPEHGGGVLRFNPSDPNVYSRFCTLQNQLQELEQQVQAQSPTGTDAVQLLAQADQRAKELLAEVFGPGNDFDAMLGGTNLLAVAGNGERVITNLFAALQPFWKPVPASARMPKPRWPCSRPRQRAPRAGCRYEQLAAAHPAGGWRKSISDSFGLPRYSGYSASVERCQRAGIHPLAGGPGPIL